jgi:protein gp37
VLDQIIVGGESSQGSHKARPFDIGWARSTVQQCKAAGVAVFFKQAGSHPVLDGKRLILRDRTGADLTELPADLNVQEFPDA